MKKDVLARNFIKKETQAQVFSCEFCEISKNTFLQNTFGRLLLAIFMVKTAHLSVLIRGVLKAKPNIWKPLNLVTKTSFLDVCRDSEYALFIHFILYLIMFFHNF